MESSKLIERQARRRYELARLRRALIGFLPVFALVGVAAPFAKRPSSTVAFGIAVFALGAALLWYGRDPKRAVLPGVAAGIVPLVFALCAEHVEHGCTGAYCMTLCIPACTAGGVLAGLVVAGLGLRRRLGASFWGAASAVALLTGAMGCSCVGYAGVLGLALGFGGGLGLGLVQNAAHRSS